MKKLLSLFLIINCFAIAVAQNQSPQIHFKWNKETYPVYQQAINKLVFQMKNCPEAHAALVEKDIKAVSFVSNCSRTSDKSSEYNYEVNLSKNIDVSELKQFFTSIHVTEFYFNGNKVYTEDLLTMDQVMAKKAQVAQENSSITVNSQMSAEEKKMFNLQNAEVKLNSLYDENYPRYLYSGNVAVLKDHIKSILQQK